MIQSQFILDILNLLLDGDDDGLLLRKQIPFLTDTDYEYTGVGVIIGFSANQQIDEYKLGDRSFIIDGVKLKSKDLEFGAEATASIKNGILDFLDIWSYSGDYPRTELTSYVLTQEWKGSPGKQITKE